MVAVNLTLNLNGGFSEEELNQRMFILGELIINQIKENIRNMRLIENGQLLQGWFASFNGRELTIENTQDYMIYLEFGTYEYWSRYGEESYPANPDPKKKDLPANLRKNFPRGAQPFAFIRKVLYNPIVMDDLAKKAFS